MAEIRTVTTLVKKRDEIRATIRMCQKKIAQARSDLAHVTAIMQLFEASGRAQDLARYADSDRLFSRAVGHLCQGAGQLAAHNQVTGAGIDKGQATGSAGRHAG
jgi:hypothetical protein